MELNHVVEILALDTAEAKDQGDLEKLQRHWLNLGHTLTHAENLYGFVIDHSEEVCSTFGDDPYCFGVGWAIACVPNPLRIACNVFRLAAMIVSFAILAGVTVAYQAVSDIYEIATLGELHLLSFAPHANMNFLRNNELFSNLMLSFVICKVPIQLSTANTTLEQRTSTHLNTIKKIGKH